MTNHESDSLFVLKSRWFFCSSLDDDDDIVYYHLESNGGDSTDMTCEGSLSRGQFEDRVSYGRPVEDWCSEGVSISNINIVSVILYRETELLFQ